MQQTLLNMIIVKGFNNKQSTLLKSMFPQQSRTLQKNLINCSAQEIVLKDEVSKIAKNAKYLKLFATIKERCKRKH